MSWIVDVTLQHRGRNDENVEYVEFDLREEAEAAVDKLKDDMSKVGPDDFITITSNRRRIDFIKQDFRRVRMYERRPSRPGGIIA